VSFEITAVILSSRLLLRQSFEIFFHHDNS
jgi:hypothetical protein